MRRLTNERLLLIRTLVFLRHTAERSLALADDLDPGRHFDEELPFGSFEDIGRHCHAMSRRAAETFFTMTGFFHFDVSATELSTVTPSERITRALDEHELTSLRRSKPLPPRRKHA